MPNNAYKRSAKRERELVNKYRALGWDCCRSAGSKSPWDVWAVNPRSGEVVLIQVKTTKYGHKLETERVHNVGNVEFWLFKWV